MPQDVVFLAAGETYKDALDPSSQASEDQCSAALQQAGLWNVVEAAGGLDAKVGPDALSQGQKQLFGLAIAVLRAQRRGGSGGGILLLDEVTANVDRETEKTIMRVIGDVFRSCTVLAVTHSLESVIDFDRVFVMGDGEVIKEGSPRTLMKEGHMST